MKNNSETGVISIKRFIQQYFGTDHSCSKLKHEGLKSFNNPYIVGISNDFAKKNPECVIKNQVIVVADDYRKIGTYVNPENLKMLLELEICKLQLKSLEKVELHNFYGVTTLYEKFSELEKRIEILEALYGDTYDILYFSNKRKVLREIRKYAKMEAEKRTTLVELPILPLEFKDRIELAYNNLIETTEENISDLNNEDFEDYEVTEKVVRIKKLENKRYY